MKKIYLFIYCSIIVPFQLGAHPMPNSVINLSVLSSSISAEASVPLIELQSALGVDLEANFQKNLVKEYFNHHIVAFSGTNKWVTIIDSLNIVTIRDPIVGKYQEVIVYFSLIPPDLSQLRKFTFNYDAVIHRVINHSALVFIHQDWRNGIQQANKTKQLGVIQLDIPTGKILPLEIVLAKGSLWNGFVSIFLLGNDHIISGKDHLLFIITLLLPVCLLANKSGWTKYGGLKYSLIKVFKIITAFTLGHTITLLIGSANMMRLPSQLIEICIAVSILVSAIHAMRPFFFNKEVFIAAGFGLIHGLAFSQTLQSLRLERWDLLIGVLGFNLGIETMQVLIIAMILPWIILVSKTAYFKTIKFILALLICGIALAWIVERITNVPNIISNLIDGMFHFSEWIVLLFALFSIGISILDKKYNNQLQNP